MIFYRHLDKYAEIYLSAVLLIIFSLLTIIQVVMRYFFNHSLTWSEELARYAFIWFVYTSATYAVRYQRHVKFNFLVNFSKRISLKLSKSIQILALLFWVSFLIFLDYFSIKLVVNQYHTGQLSPANQIPIYLIYIGLPAGAFLMTFRVVQHILRETKELFTLFTEKKYE